MSNIQDENKPTSKSVGYSNELKDRIYSTIQKIGSKKEAASVAGITPEQMGKWRDGVSKPSFYGMAKLAQAAKVSLDWLAYGKDPAWEQQRNAVAHGMPVLNEDLLVACIEGLEEKLNNEGKMLEPERKARACLYLYQLSMAVPGFSEGGTVDETIVENYLNSL